MIALPQFLLTTGTPAAGLVLCLQTGSRCVTTHGGGGFKISDVRAKEDALEVTARGLPILSGRQRARADGARRQRLGIFPVVGLEWRC